MVAAKLAALAHGQRQTGKFAAVPTQAEAADCSTLAERTIRHAREVLDHGVPELRQAVDRGEVSVSAAADVATEPAEVQQEIVARGEREILQAAKQIRAERAEARRSQRIQNLIEISKGNSALPAGRKYPIILADPPWLVRASAVQRKPEGGEPLPDLGNRRDLRAPDSRTLRAQRRCCSSGRRRRFSSNAFRSFVLGALNIERALSGPKTKSGWACTCASSTSILLIARRGEIPLPAPHARPPSVIQAPRGAHSEKPAEAYALIERMYPELPKIELFARAKRDGWSVGGRGACRREQVNPFAVPDFLLRSAP